MGVDLRPLHAQRWGVTGVIIRSVRRGGAAARSDLTGVKTDRWGRVALGDVIVEVDGKKVESFDDLYTALEPHKPGDRVRVRVQRGEDARDVTVTLEEIQ